MDTTPKAREEVIKLYKEILMTGDLSDVGVDELLNVLQPDSLLERFAYRKRAGLAANGRDFVKLKGTRGQINHDDKNM